MLIGLTERSRIGSTDRRRRRCARSPRERRTVVLLDQKVSNQAGVTPITVRKKVDVDQPVVEADGDFVDRFSVFKPVPGIAKKRG